MIRLKLNINLSLAEEKETDDGSESASAERGLPLKSGVGGETSRQPRCECFFGVSDSSVFLIDLWFLSVFDWLPYLSRLYMDPDESSVVSSILVPAKPQYSYIPGILLKEIAGTRDASANPMPGPTAGVC